MSTRSNSYHTLESAIAKANTQIHDLEQCLEECFGYKVCKARPEVDGLGQSLQSVQPILPGDIETMQSG